MLSIQIKKKKIVVGHATKMVKHQRINKLTFEIKTDGFAIPIHRSYHSKNLENQKWTTWDRLTQKQCGAQSCNPEDLN